jgi:hypothetical protein
VFRDRGIVEADLAGDLLRRRVAGHVVIAHLQGEFQEFLLPVGEGINQGWSVRITVPLSKTPPAYPQISLCPGRSTV